MWGRAVKIAITGHTSGLGQSFSDSLIMNGHEIFVMCRSNGYDVESDFDKIIDAALQSDIFINNVHSGTTQAKFIENLYGKVKLITYGSMGADYVTELSGYRYEKLLIQQTHQKYKKMTDVPMLLLKMGYLENFKDRKHIKYNSVVSLVQYWANDSSATIFEFDNHPTVYGYAVSLD